MNLTLFHPIVIIIAFATQGALAAQDYKFQVVECGTYDLIPRGMNNAGIVVGGAQQAETDGALALCTPTACAEPPDLAEAAYHSQASRTTVPSWHSPRG